MSQRRRNERAVRDEFSADKLLSPEQIVAIEQFIEELGGIEKAKLAMEVLEDLNEAA